MAYEYQSFATLGVNLNRQNYGALDISQVFTSQADLNYYISKGAITEGVSTYWYDATDAENIKKVVPYPYAGQYLALVDNTTREVTAYILVEKADGTFEPKEVGKAPVGDGKSIDVNNAGVISLKGFDALTEDEKEYLPRVKWIEASGDVAAHAEIEWVPVDAVVEGDGNTVTTISHALDEGWGVDDTSIDIEKVEDENGNFDYKLATKVYELNHDNVDDGEYTNYNQYSFKTSLKGVQQSIEYLNIPKVSYVESIEEKVGLTAAENEGEATGLIAEVAKKANAADVYTKEEADGLLNGKVDNTTLTDYYTKTQADTKFADKATTLAGYGITDAYTKDETNSAINTAIAAADHLKRKVVDSTNDIDVTAADATQYIYMVPAGTDEISNQDIYDEYMVIEKVEKNEETGEETTTKVLERLGSWQVDLSDYVTTETLSNALTGYYTKGEVDGLIAPLATKEALAATNEEVGKKANSADVYTKGEVDGLVAPLATKEEVNKKADAETVNAALALKADADKVYTKDEADDLLDAKANANAVYTKDETDDLLDAKANANAVYTKEEIDEIIGDPGIPAEGETTAVPGTGIYENVYSKAEITELIEGVTGGESAAAVKAALTQYQTTNDAAVKGISDRVGIVEEHIKDVEAGAQVNVIDTVASEFAVENKELQLVSVPVGKLSGLDTEEIAVTKIGEETEGKLRIVNVSATKLTDLNADELAVADGKLGIKAVPMSKITGLSDRLSGIDNKFNDYVTKTTYSAEFGTHTNLKNMSGKESHTAIDEINALIDALTWVNMQ